MFSCFSAALATDVFVNTTMKMRSDSFHFDTPSVFLFPVQPPPEFLSGLRHQAVCLNCSERKGKGQRFIP